MKKLMHAIMLLHTNDKFDQINCLQNVVPKAGQKMLMTGSAETMVGRSIVIFFLISDKFQYNST